MKHWCNFCIDYHYLEAVGVVATSSLDLALFVGTIQWGGLNNVDMQYSELNCIQQDILRLN